MLTKSLPSGVRVQAGETGGEQNEKTLTVVPMTEEDPGRAGCGGQDVCCVSGGAWVGGAVWRSWVRLRGSLKGLPQGLGDCVLSLESEGGR